MVKYYQHELDYIFTAISDPTRRAILNRLSESEACVSDLAEPFNMSLVAVSKHLRMLERAGLVERMKKGRFHHFRLVIAPLKDAYDWLKRYEYFWNKQFDSLTHYLENSEDNSQNNKET
jgi:DNA-binding transcriptional ArsR family regulator